MTSNFYTTILMSFALVDEVSQPDLVPRLPQIRSISKKALIKTISRT